MPCPMCGERTNLIGSAIERFSRKRSGGVACATEVVIKTAAAAARRSSDGDMGSIPDEWFDWRIDWTIAGYGRKWQRYWMPISDRKSTRLNSSHGYISYAVFCLKKKPPDERTQLRRSEQTPPHSP